MAALQNRSPGDWARSEYLALLERWAAFAPTENGFFSTDADVHWRPRGENTATLVSQTRMIFVFSRGVDFLAGTGTHPKLREAMSSALRPGIEFFLSKFHDSRSGGWFQSVDRAGGVIDTGKDLYGHAFAILALAAASSSGAVFPSRDCADDAVLETIRVATGPFRDGEGGFIRHMDAAFSRDLDDKRTQNPVMHLFEALSEASDASGLAPETRSAARDAAVAVLGLVLDRLYDRARHCIPEFHDRGWKPLPAEQGGRIDLGHQFEWSYLLRSAPAAVGRRRRRMAAADELLRFALDNAVRRDNGAVRSTLASGPGDPIVSWTQCEAVRAAAKAGADHAAAAALLLDFYARYFADPVSGGCYSTVSPDGEVVAGDKGSVYKVGYHETGMLLSLAT
ncbi:MAG: AGE family epimerase/isomerase [Planctomycetes bacterium]|nr:AGE family epimerase/isomerase [Planctomycetota bacterium]